MVKFGRLTGVALAGAFLSVAIAAAADEAPAPGTPAAQATQPAAQEPQPQPQPPATTTEEDDPIVCKTEDSGVGSRLRGRRICKKKSAWRDEKGPDRIIHVPDNTISRDPGGGAGAGGARQPTN